MAKQIITVTIEEVEEAVREYGRACEAVVGSYEWGTGSVSEEKAKVQTFEDVMNIIKKMVEEVKRDNISVCENCGSWLRAGECENCNSPYKNE